MTTSTASKTSALIGHTGFVGGNLKSQGSFSDFFNTSNLESMYGRSFDLVVSAGAPAAKWIANQKPAEDWAQLERLMRALERVSAKRFILISTVDVYPRPVDVAETTPIEPAELQPYGRNRLYLEHFVAARFSGSTRVRLPGLFGPGLKKNVVYDFLNENRLDLVHQDGVFQFYDLAYLWRDVRSALDAGLEVVNFATEPVSTLEIAQEVFEREFTNTLPEPGPRYDFKTVHAAAFGKRGPYLYTKDDVLRGMKVFVAAERAKKLRA